MKIVLVDTNPGMVAAWHQAFADTDVDIAHGSIFDHPVEAIVSPANSYGFMDGSLDLAISKRFGWDVQRRLQAIIQSKCNGELLVGQAVAVTTDDLKMLFVISAPTMRVPMYLGAETINPYLATRAALGCAAAIGISSVAFAGMGTGVGGVPFIVCAKQMRQAYDDFLSPPPYPRTWEESQARHQRLLWDGVPSGGPK